MFQKDKSNRGRGMKNKLISEHLISEEELIKFMEKDCKLLTSNGSECVVPKISRLKVFVC